MASTVSPATTGSPGSRAIRSSLPNSATLEILYEGVVYATIDTTTPNNVVFSNGASGSWGGSTDLATLSNLVVNLPVLQNGFQSLGCGSKFFNF